jgi:GTPase SAR1 family protein
MAGLNGAGKTTLCRRIFTHSQNLPQTPTDGVSEPVPPVPEATAEELDSVPTIGVDPIKIKLGGKVFDVLDMSGQKGLSTTNQ